MFCEKCGAKLKDDVLFCYNCGSKQNVEQISEQKIKESVADTQKEYETEKATVGNTVESARVTESLNVTKVSDATEKISSEKSTVADNEKATMKIEKETKPKAKPGKQKESKAKKRIRPLLIILAAAALIVGGVFGWIEITERNLMHNIIYGFGDDTAKEINFDGVWVFVGKENENGMRFYHAKWCLNIDASENIITDITIGNDGTVSAVDYEYKYKENYLKYGSNNKYYLIKSGDGDLILVSSYKGDTFPWLYFEKIYESPEDYFGYGN